MEDKFSMVKDERSILERLTYLKFDDLTNEPLVKPVRKFEVGYYIPNISFEGLYSPGRS